MGVSVRPPTRVQLRPLTPVQLRPPTKQDVWICLGSQLLPDSNEVSSTWLRREEALPARRENVCQPELDKHVKGYKELRKELTQVRRDISRQREKSVLDERIIRTTYYKSPVGTRSEKGSGSVFYSNPVGRQAFFSSVKRV